MDATCDFRDFQTSASLDLTLRYPNFTADVAPERHRVRVSGRSPQWVEAVARRLSELLQLGPDWDPRGADPISREDLRDAIMFMVKTMRDDTRAPWIGPLASGGVELVWRGDNVEVEAVFDRSRNEQGLLVSAGEHETEAPIDEAESLFATVVDRLSEADPVGV